jgi:L-rhamnose isomerase
LKPLSTLATERYAALGVDVAHALKTLATIPISLHCWQGDDVGGFENLRGGLGGGLVATGNYPGKARTPEELRADLEKAYSLIPGKHRLNLHAFYGEFGGKKVDRDEIEPKHFKNWIAWAKKRPRPRFQSDLLLASQSRRWLHPVACGRGIRQFWIEHCIRSREIGAAMGKALGKTCVTNVWIPDGMKDTPPTASARANAWPESLDAIFKKPFRPS